MPYEVYIGKRSEIIEQITDNRAQRTEKRKT